MVETLRRHWSYCNGTSLLVRSSVAQNVCKPRSILVHAAAFFSSLPAVSIAVVVVMEGGKVIVSVPPKSGTKILKITFLSAPLSTVTVR